jgi:hypothetical protein
VISPFMSFFFSNATLTNSYLLDCFWGLNSKPILSKFARLSTFKDGPRKPHQSKTLGTYACKIPDQTYHLFIMISAIIHIQSSWYEMAMKLCFIVIFKALGIKMLFFLIIILI